MFVNWVLFDLNGTLLDPTTAVRSIGAGESERRLALSALDEGICLAMTDTATGGYRQFSDHLRACLKRNLTLAGHSDAAIDSALELVGGGLEAYPGAEEALIKLAQAGLRLAVLTNSATSQAETALQRAGLRDRFEHVIGTDQVQAFKPDPRVYRHGASVLEAKPQQILFVAAHGWDVFAAKRLGFQTGWVATNEGVLAETVPEPDLQAQTLEKLADDVVEAGKSTGEAKA